MSDIIDALDLTRKMIGFDTINPPGQELRCIEFIADALDGYGFEIDIFTYDEGRANLVARLAATAPGGLLPLVFSGHVDTVPLGRGEWTTPPFDGMVRDGRLYGRGASDMKSGIAAFIVAARRLARRPTRNADILLIISSGEETGCEGVLRLVGDGSLDGAFGAMIVAEPTDARPMLGHKGALWLSLITSGVTAHGSMPQTGVNAVVGAARLIERLLQFDFGVEAHPVMGSPTLNIGTIHGGMNINSVPDQAIVGVDIRTVAGLSTGETLSSLRRFVGEDVQIEPIISMDCVFTDIDAPFIRMVYSTIETMTGSAPAPATASYFSDASVLTKAFGSPPTLIMGPGAMAMAHQADEYCEIEKLYFCVDAFTRIASTYVQ